MTVPRIPNPFDDDAQRLARLEAHVDTGKRYWRWVFVGGWVVLAGWVMLALLGLPGTGLVLVPIGIFMILGAGIQLLIER